MSPPSNYDFPVRIGNVRLRNPVIAASGTYGYGLEYSCFGDPALLGAVVVKSLTATPRPGFSPPRVAPLDYPGSLLNSIGVPNPGIRAWAETILPTMMAAGVATVVSIWGESYEELLEAAEILGEYPGAIAWEVNLSCPNALRQSVPISHVPDLAGAAVADIRRIAGPNVGLWAKLSPDTPDIVEAAAACADGGADAVTIANTYPGMRIDLETQKSVLGSPTGGMSGAILREFVPPLVEKVHAQALRIPIIGCGGVLNSATAMEYLEAGAVAVQVGTASLYDPRACHKIARGVVRSLGATVRNKRVHIT